MNRSIGYKKLVIILLGIVIACVAAVVESKAQSHEGYMYGKVHTDNTIYIGPIRWGGEEVFWTDLFNAAKAKNDYAKQVPKEKEESEGWSSYDWNFSSIWENKVTVHQFTCQFGNIKEMIPLKSGNVIVRLKNGGEMEMDGDGYNDIGGNVQVLDNELGVVSVSWSKIKRVEFINTPQKLEQVFGQPLYGTVEGARREKFTGFIVWDNDERLASDKLDGDTRGGDVAIKFSDIESIESRSNGCDVFLKSGRQLFLTGSNDVNSGNRGVLVSTPDYGIIKFSWDAFKKITFSTAPHSGQTYQQFLIPRPLQGIVRQLEGNDLEGRIIYDIDEALDFEILEGKENDIEYMIPFTNIKKITPKNFDYSLIELNSGETFLLGGMRDVSKNNGGVLVFVKGKKEPVYVSWKKIDEIVFN